MSTTPLLPLPEGLEITAVSTTDRGLQIRVISHRDRSICPRCSQPSQAIHSYYRRKPLELPCAGQLVRLELTVKKFFCRERTCPQKIFAERLPEFLEPSSRLTTRLRTIVQAMAGAFNAKGGARLGAHSVAPYCVQGPTVSQSHASSFLEHAVLALLGNVLATVPKPERMGVGQPNWKQEGPMPRRFPNMVPHPVPVEGFGCVHATGSARRHLQVCS